MSCEKDHGHSQTHVYSPSSVYCTDYIRCSVCISLNSTEVVFIVASLGVYSTCRTRLLRGSSRGCHEDAMRKTVPWNLSLYIYTVNAVDVVRAMTTTHLCVIASTSHVAVVSPVHLGVNCAV